MQERRKRKQADGERKMDAEKEAAVTQREAEITKRAKTQKR